MPLRLAHFAHLGNGRLASPSRLAVRVTRTPVGRIGNPEDVADAVAFLIGNGFVNGETIVRDHGIRWAA